MDKHVITAKDIVYISGPMTGFPFCNVPAFCETEHYLVNVYGCKVLSPARHTADMDYSFYMHHAYIDVRHSSVIVMLPNWKRSAGALQEWCWSRELGIKIIEFESIIKRTEGKL